MTEKFANPASPTNEVSVETRKRRPFSKGDLKLSVPEIPGYHLHWFLGTPERFARAEDAGYTFVTKEDIALSNHSLGSDVIQDGNTDMGTKVSRVAGGDLTESGQPARLYLMKIKEEYWKEDQAELTAPGSRIDQVRMAMLQGITGQPENAGVVYVDKKRTTVPTFFQRRDERKA